ncbi:hypothetical protein Pcinc_005373 [Petrolisthes cinctipes]|uniref:Uncharacterized protein n=1 Tax=Petrolisthes cinctipes TaxID=88211 RepID=A0AAE1L2S5_PETCI|nr:hypothetical protein Pcinc_005373 [Petrolisthes cinctipes]
MEDRISALEETATGTQNNTEKPSNNEGSNKRKYRRQNYNWIDRECEESDSESPSTTILRRNSSGSRRVTSRHYTNPPPQQPRHNAALHRPTKTGCYNCGEFVRSSGSSNRGLDLGLGRGITGSQAAKHLMGLAAANFAGGPGRKRRSSPDEASSHPNEALTKFNEALTHPNEALTHPNEALNKFNEALTALNHPNEALNKFNEDLTHPNEALTQKMA